MAAGPGWELTGSLHRGAQVLAVSKQGSCYKGLEGGVVRDLPGDAQSAALDSELTTSPVLSPVSFSPIISTVHGVRI